MIRVSDIKLTLDQDESEIKQVLLAKLKIKEKDLIDYNIFKRSIDARKRDNIYFVYTIDAVVAQEAKILKRFAKDKDVAPTPKLNYEYVQTGLVPLKNRPVVIGTGPAGLFAGLILAQMGYQPLLLERGADVDRRTEVVKKFWSTGELDTECNVQFGEGGAGTFSDGKLTTLIRDLRCRKVLEELVEAGAPTEIMYSHKPHVGTDVLRVVVKNLRQRIISLGGEVRFNAKVTDLLVEQGKVTGVVINDNEQVATEVVILAVGHSARDTFHMLYNKGVEITPKAFSIGVRIEHPQELINAAQYKQFAGHPRLGAAEYKLAYHSPSGRSAYTFCMCPGGVVVAAASEAGGVVTNGMSEHARNAKNANSALLVGVTPADFGSDHPLAGVEFQRQWERKAFELGGRNYHAPAQLVGDFLQDRPSTGFGSVEPSYRKAVALAELKHCLPPYVVQTLKEAIVDFDRKLKGFALPDAVLTGVETRSSSPIRIERNEQRQANIEGLYPAGEGAGYAGGIVSAAVDGIRVAEAVASKFRPLGESTV
ncbi:FAD dependent oxidoreductase [Desulfotomaculum nigrificans CO-1-SRB]|uniref:FAD dependent oxidoreductase n=1 Tax=Desulfotomaculum nigrificans (strain DSM 14880 / VKM B-2319 / CO-1-SRB) TaxID=868595 RepID=F6B9V9_DESCC|nr:NAD(P)/FAD-dependent oxidoreductase [Desulfotomaculum nigrificans]AEF93807.1 FAD dependent oxidoreductase [Desulfotomaculum nigrificans CO-1-SRB]